MHQNHSKANIKLRLLQEQSNIRSNTINSSVWSIWASKNLCNTFSSTQLIVVTGRNNPDQEFNMQWQERTLDLTCWLTQFQWYPRTRTQTQRQPHDHMSHKPRCSIALKRQEYRPHMLDRPMQQPELGITRHVTLTTLGTSSKWTNIQILLRMFTMFCSLLFRFVPLAVPLALWQIAQWCTSNRTWHFPELLADPSALTAAKAPAVWDTLGHIWSHYPHWAAPIVPQHSLISKWLLNLHRAQPPTNIIKHPQTKNGSLSLHKNILFATESLSSRPLSVLVPL